ncbi:uncharacterized protein [Asterias amurensis]|uniref:uncharacterized protein n=1 Tax=Asterias amurensis TaxID=7602 RepID=UPI003AB82B18
MYASPSGSGFVFVVASSGYSPLLLGIDSTARFTPALSFSLQREPTIQLWILRFSSSICEISSVKTRLVREREREREFYVSMTLWVNLVVVAAVCLLGGPVLVYTDDNDSHEVQPDSQPLATVVNPCPSPPKLENGASTLDEILGNIFYRCNPGYALYGPNGNTLRCLDGQWVGSVPVCSAKGCAEKSVVEFSSMTRRNRGTVWKVDCWAGYELEGPAFIYCDGTRWRNEPRCVLQKSPHNSAPSCPDPPRILNAIMTITQGGRGVSYSCASGFTQKLGSKTLQCNSDGQWNGIAAVCARAGCRIPRVNAVSNGVIVVKQSMVLKMTCHPGYDLSGSAALFCDGQRWNGSLPTCRPQQTQQRDDGYPSRVEDGTRCGRIPSVPNSSPQYGVERDVLGRSFYTVRYICDSGHTIKPANYAVYCSAGNVVGTLPHCYAQCGYENGGCQHVCTNTDKGAVCSCRDGFKLADNEKRCTDIDECASNRGRGACAFRCVNHVGGFQCYCNHGYTLATDGTSCTEIPKSCSCGTHGHCVEARGTTPAFCRCNDGYQQSTDRLSCERVSQTQCSCGTGSISCWEGNGERICTCRTGYQQSGNGCVDINECQENGGLGDCQKGCENIAGSFRCYCPGRWQYLSEDLRTCRERPCSCGTGSTGCSQPNGRRICTCAEGYKPSQTGDRCVDRNECQDSTPCEGSCVNTEGSYQCSCPQSGYQLAQDGYRCEDVNECQEDKLNQCKGVCLNTPGSYQCECPAGHLLMPDGISCVGCRTNSYYSSTSNECFECPQYSRTNGNAKATIEDCHCMPGYNEHPGEEILCKDIDECNVNNGGCEHDCINTPGDFYCACPEGFKLIDNGEDCVDRDECAQSKGGCQHNCVNSEGSFQCTCNEGYMVDPEDSYLCADVDECSQGTHGCEQDCVNYPGSYHCACNNSSILAEDGKTCNPITCNPLLLPDKMRVSPVKLCQGNHATKKIIVGTTCTVECKRGYELRGPANRTCLNTRQWSAQPASCIPIRCPALQNPKNGLVHPSSCLQNDSSAFQGSCVFSCDEGYALVGTSLTSCEQSGTWSLETPTCKQVSEITCPQDVTRILEPGQAQAVIDLVEPVHSLNRIESSVPTQGHAFDVGTTEVVYTAFSNTSDSSVKCSFNVIVKDEERPVFRLCPKSFTVKTAEQYPTVTWDEPVITDNVGVVSNTTRISPDRPFTWGTYTVLIDASDGSGNTVTCQFSISIQTKECGTPVAPANGAISCSDWMFGKICEPSCDKSHYFFEGLPSSVFLCGFDGVWSPSSIAPDCSPYEENPELPCPIGTVQTSFPAIEGEVCISCPRGMFYVEVNSTFVCLPCPVGTYQDEFGQESCKPCEPGQTTEGKSSKASTDCQASEVMPTTMEVPATSVEMAHNQTTTHSTEVAEEIN